MTLEKETIDVYQELCREMPANSGPMNRGMLAFIRVVERRLGVMAAKLQELERRIQQAIGQ
jgi:hypothetical protein